MEKCTWSVGVQADETDFNYQTDETHGIGEEAVGEDGLPSSTGAPNVPPLKLDN